MEKNEIIISGSQLPSTASNEMLLDALHSMASLLRTTNERMQRLELEVKRLTKVTPSQVTALNSAIRKRAGELCLQHRAPGCEKAITAAIRKAIKQTCGISSARELPRCDYPVAMQQVEMWDDYRLIRDIKRREADR